VAGISVDSPYCHRAFAEELEIPFPLLSDFNREISRAYRIPVRQLRLLSDVTGRTAFVIDSACVIRFAWYPEEGSRGLPPLDEVLQAVKALPGDPPGDAPGGPGAGF
jgi:peroxiredoxin